MGRCNHPVGFAAQLRGEMLAVKGDTGVRRVLARHNASIERVACDNPGILFDTDTPADLDRGALGQVATAS
jgi:CTP:molybdopterin cytidylyltransferase MocA